MRAASFHEKRDGWAGRRTHLSGGGATLLSSHAGRSFTPAADTTHERQPRQGRQARWKPDDRCEGPNHRTSGPVTLTLRSTLSDGRAATQANRPIVRWRASLHATIT